MNRIGLVTQIQKQGQKIGGPTNRATEFKIRLSKLKTIHRVMITMVP